MKKRDPIKQAKLDKVSRKRALYEKARRQKNKLNKTKRVEKTYEPAKQFLP